MESRFGVRMGVSTGIKVAARINLGFLATVGIRIGVRVRLGYYF